MTEAVQKLEDVVDSSRSIVFFGGAGVSTDPASRISAAPTVFTTSSGATRLR